jgi:hypothetical protein
VSEVREDADERLDAIVTRCLAKEPSQRFATMEELAAALEADPAARRLWFLRNDIELGLAAIAEQNRSEIVVPDRVATAAVKRPRAAAIAGGTMALAGLAVGVFGASAVWALAVPAPGAVGTTIPVLAESFEDGQAKTVPGLPRGLTDPDGDIWRLGLTPEEIIASVKNGIFARSFSGGQVNISNGDFVFSVTEGYLIEDGKITAPVRDVNLIGNGPDCLTRVSMVGSDFMLSDGRWTCGKDGQSVPVGVGIPTVKIDAMTVGGSKV